VREEVVFAGLCFDRFSHAQECRKLGNTIPLACFMSQVMKPVALLIECICWGSVIAE